MNGERMMVARAGSSRVAFAPEADPYPWIRSALESEYADLRAEDIEALLARNGINAAAMEGLFDDIGNFVKKAAPVVAQVAGRALPGVISGATSGAALGPWGALGGAVLGGVTSALGGGKPGAPQPGGAPAAGPLGAISSALPALAGLVGGGGNPAGAILDAIRKPGFVQSLMAMALQGAGKKSVPMGAAGTPVPTSAVANVLSVLGSKAFAQAEAAAEPSEAYPVYLYKEGRLTLDPADSEQRAARVLELLGETAYVRPAPRSTPRYTEMDEFYDAIDIAELEEIELEAMDPELEEGVMLGDD
jgi:hypothetical protein